MSEDMGAAPRAGLPYSQEAEMGMLGCLFGDPGNLVHEARATLPADGFYNPVHRQVYELMVEFQDKPGRLLDLVTFTTFVSDKGLLDKVGGAPFITELATSFVPSPGQFGHYRAILIDKMLLRRAIGACTAGIREAYEFHDDVSVYLSRTENAIFDVLHQAQTRGSHAVGPVGADAFVPEWVDHLEQVFRNRGKVMGIRTGLNEIDLTLHGINDSEGEICILAGRPGQGKTALAGTIADHCAEQGWPGVVYSLEMSRVQLLDRIIVGGAGVDTVKCITGMFSREEFKAVSERALVWSRYPVKMNDGASLTTADLRSQVQVLKRKHGIRWLMLDHLHLMHGVRKASQEDERMRLVECMETLQFLKKQFKLAIFLMVQLNRESDRKKVGEPPVLADLSGSAAIEQYADHVLFIHRPAYYRPWLALKDAEKRRWTEGHLEFRWRNPELWSRGEKYPDGAGDADEEEGTPASAGWARQDYEESADIYVRKNRRGPTPVLTVRYQAEFTRFSTRTPKLYSNAAADRQVAYERGAAGGESSMQDVFGD